jgi:hypothetical protein
MRNTGVLHQLTSPSTPAQSHDPKCCVIDQCILSWIYNSVSKDVLAIVRVPQPTAYIIWTGI